MTTKAALTFFPAALLASTGLLAPVAHARTPESAHVQVRRWIETHPAAFGGALGKPTGDVLTVGTNGTNLFHSVELAGGGFAILSDADGTMLAFSGEGRFSTENAAPLWMMLLADTGGTVLGRTPGGAPVPLVKPAHGAPDLPAGISVTKTRTAASAALLTATSVPSQSGLEDLRVSPLVHSTWDQKTAGGKNVYNYYTPGNVYCGCVATAMSQVMRMHEHPAESVPAKTKACTYNGVATNLTMQGGTYSWSDMPLNPSSSITATQQQAIGKLTSDAGISVHMAYASDGSGAFGAVCAHAFTNTWGYAQSQYWMSGKSGEAADGYLPSGELEDAILANLDAGFPCILGIEGNGSGHAVVADGYGYLDAQRYIHLNMGWSGSCDYWYCVPVSASRYTFSYLSDIVYNIFPSDTGNIVSGRVVSTNGTAVAGATVEWSGYKSARKGRMTTKTAISGTTSTSDRGVYAFIVPDASVSITNVTVSLSGYDPATTNGISTTASASYFINESEIEDDPSVSTVSLYCQSTPAIGNSWGNDITLAAYYVEPSFAATPALSATDGSLALVTSATAGTVWTLQWNDDLADETGWTDLMSFTAAGEPRSIVLDSSLFDWTSTPRAFFRIVPAE